VLALVVLAVLSGSAGVALGWFQKTAAIMRSNDEVTVRDVEADLSRSTSGKPVNILLIGSDRRKGAEADKGRSDTMILVRLDPGTGCMSMLSVPRDLYVTIPGYGQDRVNVAYTVGGPKLTVQMFKELTGLPIHHFMDVNFIGFANIVDYLGGVYIDVDRRYYNPPGTGWAAIDLQPGYQKLTGRQALSFVRFRHDERGDFNRMIRQQVFLHEVERQIKRWQNITKMPAVFKAIARNTISDMSSVGTLLDLANTLLDLNTSRVYQAHLEASTGMVNGMSVIQASPEEIKRAVDDFLDPRQAPMRAQADKIPRNGFTVRVLNGGGSSGLADTVAAQLRDAGYTAVVAGNADSFTYTKSVVYASKGLKKWAQNVAQSVRPATVRQVPRLPGTLPGITVVVGNQFTGVPEDGGRTSNNTLAVQSQILRNTRQDEARWQQLASSTRLKVMMPTVWSTGMAYETVTGYDPTYRNFRSYKIKTSDGQRTAVCVVGKTASGGYWHIQETSWMEPPILSDPNDVRTIKGREYMLFYQNDRLHRVAFKANGCLYWVTNTLRDELSDELMLALATSLQPVL
jgi:LCP family protein required for cell wall assembly